METGVRDYYGKTLKSGADLKTDACCSPSALPRPVREALTKVHDEVTARYYGCGLTIPGELSGLSVLDLGSGSGRDCYILSQLVGAKGRVTGVDMTDEPLEVAERHRAHHAEAFGYGNVEFLKGDISRLDALGLADASYDLIVSNCVINLARDKASVLREARRVLKEGGELYFSDVYADRRVPEELRNDPVLYGECLGGALYWNDFLALARRAGFADPRLVESRPLALDAGPIRERAGHIGFYSATYRLFKLEGLEPACEDYGQAVRYKGTIADAPREFRLDGHHRFEAGRIMTVCGNTSLMLERSRFSRHFDFLGDRTTHFGIFPGCGTSLPFAAEPRNDGACC
ncbi:MAG: methyltransferase domain-containing protein [Elusimicrobia bacterium]|nr:methyltransferase domain-containing protein [Elusimicrobiota bacterium]